MKKLIGSFYFKKTNDFNLIGEFANNALDIIRITTESANKSERVDGFVGNYLSVWHDATTHTANLTINFKFADVHNIYALKWEEDGQTTYEGEGFLLDDNTLIGFYC